MFLVAGAALVGAAVGAVWRTTAPAPRHLRAVGVDRWWLLLLGAAGQAVVVVADVPAEGTVVAVSLALVVTFAAVNMTVTGMAVVVVGVGLNLLAVVLHGAMPVRGQALVEADVVASRDLGAIELDAGRRLERPGDAAPWLGDVIPVPEIAQVLSFGDLVTLAGVANVCATVVRRMPRSSHDRRQRGPRLGDGTEPDSGVGMPVFGEPGDERAVDE